MKILLDSHVLLWALRNSPELNATAKELITNSENEIFYSPISIYEFAIKRQFKEEVANITIEKLVDGCKESEFVALPLRDEHISEIESLNKPDNVEHKDPFDRLLLCQAKAEGMHLMTHDSKLKQYKEDCIIRV